jgi:hypothetical protein
VVSINPDINHGLLIRKSIVGLLAAVLCMVFSSVLAEYSIETELDPYYSNVGYYLSLTDAPIPDVIETDESSAYSRLWDSVFTAPRFMLIEFGVYPLPILAAYTKEQHPTAYDNASIGDLNIIQAFTAGYEEPYALSLFFGSVVRFVKPGEEKKIKNRGYTGFLLSVGDQSIVHNSLVDDIWHELEWKIKGDQDFENKTLSWSLRFGGKFHDNSDITDVFYVGVRRNHLDAASDDLSWFQNADIDFKLEINQETFDLTQLSIFVNKKWPAALFKKSTFEFGVGLIFERDKYVGELETQSKDLQLVLRPSFKF